MSEKEKAPKRSFWKGVKSEFLKITWPDREAMVKQTTMVVFASLALGAIIAVLDFGLQHGVDLVTTIGAEEQEIEIDWDDFDFGDFDFGDLDVEDVDVE
jgi:preprotein translocase subunit SecE